MKVLSAIKKIIFTIIGVAFFAFALVMTILLLNYNDFGVTQFGNKSLVIITDKVSNENYEKGDLVIVREIKVKDVKVGDTLFAYRVDSKGVPSIEIGKVGTVYPEEDAIAYENGGTFSSKFIAGEPIEVHKDVGMFLSVVESQWGFLFIVLVPCFLIFIYEVYTLIIEIKYGADDD